MQGIKKVIHDGITGKKASFRLGTSEILFVDPNDSLWKIRVNRKNHNPYLFNAMLISVKKSRGFSVEWKFDMIAPVGFFDAKSPYQGMCETFCATFDIERDGDFIIATLDSIIPVRQRYYHSHGEHLDKSLPLSPILLSSSDIPEVCHG